MPSSKKVGEDRFEPIRDIRIRGAREHNLKGVDIDIPRDRMVVVTGLSGSGKSSLAFDTVFAEGQRKYMESLSAYARQFLDQIKKPDVESIEGLPPTIAIEQRSGGHNPRSTVATSTEIYDYLRLLFARCAGPTCWHPTKTKGEKVLARCGQPISAMAPTQITDAVEALGEGTTLMVLAPVVRARKGFHKDIVEDLTGAGFVRARVNGDVIDLRELDMAGENPMGLGRYQMHHIEAVVDRIVVKPAARARLADSIETALKAGSGVVVISIKDVFEQPRGFGSGFVMHKSGLILTSYHVIAGAGIVEVTFRDHAKAVPAEVMSVDHRHDVANTALQSLPQLPPVPHRCLRSNNQCGPAVPETLRPYR